MLTHDLSLLSRRMEESNFAQLSKEADAMETQLTEVNKQAAEAQTVKRMFNASADLASSGPFRRVPLQTREAAEKRSRELEREIKDFESERKNKVARVEQEVRRALHQQVTALPLHA